MRRPHLLDKAWNDAKQATDPVDFHFHNLRNEAVSRLLEAGVSDQEVAAIGGQKPIQMVKRNTHLRTEALVGKLDKLHG